MGYVPEHLKKALLNSMVPKVAVQTPDLLMKGGQANASGLVLKDITNIKGQHQKVWVKTQEDQPAPEQSKQAEEKSPKKTGKVTDINSKRPKKTDEEKEQAKEAKLKERIAKIKEEYPKLSDEQIMTRMKYMIPMDASDVKVYEDDPKLVCEFKDGKGRPQKRYTKEYSAQASQKKFERIANVGENLVDARYQVEHDLMQEGMPKDKVLATIVKLIDSAYFRVGNEKYTESNGTFGVSTFRKGHAKSDGNQVEFEYVGKKSVDQHQIVKDPQLAKIVQELQNSDSKEDNLFQYQDKSGEWKTISDRDVRNYLGKWDMKPKDFRTYHATRICATKLASMEPADDEKGRKANIKSAVEYTAKFLGHTPDICRASYINGKVLDSYLAGDNMEGWQQLEVEAKKEAPKAKEGMGEDVYKHVAENGGITINLAGDSPNEGYAYSPRKDTEHVIPEGEFNHQHISDYVDRFKYILAQKGNHLGIWVDDGNVYLDISKVGPPTEDTIKEAEKNKQLAVFDLSNFQTIYTRHGGGNEDG